MSGLENKTKFSLSIKTNKKSSFNKDLVQNKEKVEETDYVLSVEGNSIKGTKKREQKVYVIPSLPNDNQLKNKLDARELDLEVRKELAEEALTKKEPESRVEDEANAVTIPSSSNTDDLKLSVEAKADVPTMDNYDEMPIEQFGTALLRGMGWKPGQAIGARCSKAARAVEVKLRPKGLGLGAEQLLKTKEEQEADNKKLLDKKTEVLIVKSGAYVKVVEGNHKGKYGQVDGMDDEAGRVHISVAVTREKISVNEAFVVAVDKKEYNDRGRVINKDKYDDYKKKHGMDEDTRTGEKIDLSAGFTEKRKSDRKDDEGEAKKQKVEEKRPFIGYWLKSQLKVRIIDEKFKGGRYNNCKVVIEDVLTRSTCLCRTDEGRLLEDVHMDMVETVLPRSSIQQEVPVMVVAGKHERQIGYIVDRDKKRQLAYVEFVSDKSVHKIDFDSVCEYTGHV